jgi:hypothetical protein
MHIQVKPSSLVLLLLFSVSSLWAAATLRNMMETSVRMENSGEW